MATVNDSIIFNIIKVPYLSWIQKLVRTKPCTIDLSCTIQRSVCYQKLPKCFSKRTCDVERASIALWATHAASRCRQDLSCSVGKPQELRLNLFYGNYSCRSLLRAVACSSLLAHDQTSTAHRLGHLFVGHRPLGGRQHICA